MGFFNIIVIKWKITFILIIEQNNISFQYITMFLWLFVVFYDKE
jgi:hypothetical protein